MKTEKLIDDILRREGSAFTNHPNDKGGPTKYGITLATLRRVRGNQNLTAEDVEALTEPEARNIYNDEFIVAPHFDRISDDRLRALLVDWGVNSGPARPIKVVQRLVGVTDDGVLGPKSLTAVNSTDGLFEKVLAARVAYYHELVEEDPTQECFLHGWLNRCQEFV